MNDNRNMYLENIKCKLDSLYEELMFAIASEEEFRDGLDPEDGSEREEDWEIQFDDSERVADLFDDATVCIGDAMDVIYKIINENY